MRQHEEVAVREIDDAHDAKTVRPESDQAEIQPEQQAREGSSRSASARAPRLGRLLPLTAADRPLYPSGRPAVDHLEFQMSAVVGHMSCPERREFADLSAEFVEFEWSVECVEFAGLRKYRASNRSAPCSPFRQRLLEHEAGRVAGDRMKPNSTLPSGYFFFTRRGTPAASCRSSACIPALPR